MTIVNIRGTSGSGKSTLVRQLMDRSLSTEQLMEGKRIVGYELALPKLVHVVGRYETACGGCDGIKTQDEVCNRVRQFAAFGDVVFEGLLISHIYGRYRDLTRELTTHRFVWYFLDTPLDICIAQVKQRRLDAGNTKELDVTNTTQKWLDSRRVFQKAQDDGLNPMWLPYQEALPVLLAAFQ